MKIYTKLLEEYLGKYLHDFGIRKKFLTRQNTSIKLKIGQMDFIKIKAFFTLKDTINEVKWQAKHCKKIFTTHVSDKKIHIQTT